MITLIIFGLINFQYQQNNMQLFVIFISNALQIGQTKFPFFKHIKNSLGLGLDLKKKKDLLATQLGCNGTGYLTTNNIIILFLPTC